MQNIALIAFLLFAFTSPVSSDPDCGDKGTSCASEPRATVSERADDHTWIFVSEDGEPAVPSEDQITAINTLLLTMKFPIAIKEIDGAESDDAAKLSASPAALGAVDEDGNLVKPPLDQVFPAIPPDDHRREFSEPELIDPADPSQGVKARAAHSYSFGRVNEKGEIELNCIVRGEASHDCPQHVDVQESNQMEEGEEDDAQ